jgi:hypothetical protein
VSQNQLSNSAPQISIPWWVARIAKDATSRAFWITGGLGSGKTTGGAAWFVHRWFLNKESTVSWAVAPTYTKVEQILMPALRQVLLDFYGYKEDVDYRVTKSPFWKLRMNGYKHEIHLLSGDRPKHFVGSNIACWWITEPGLQDREVYEKLQTRLRCPRAVVRQGLGEGTPEGLNWYADLADIKGPGFDRYDAEKKHRRIILETTFNKHLRPSPEEYAQTQIRDVFAYDKNKVISYEKGLFVSFAKGSAYWEWVDSRNVCPSLVEASPHLPLELTFDFNVAPLAFVVLQEVTVQKNYYAPRTKKYIAISESSGESRGLMDAIAEFAAQYPVHIWGNVTIRVYGDASGYARSIHNSTGSDYKAIETYLNALGYRKVEVLAVHANPLVKHRLEKTAALMAYERFAVNHTCRRLIASFTRTALKEGTFEIEKPTKEDWTHYADACTYFLFQSAKDIDVTSPNSRRAFGANL